MGSVSWQFDWTAPSMNAPNDVKFYFAGNAANNNGFSGSGDNSYAGATALLPLPIEMTYFEVTKQKQNALLQWSTICFF